MKILYDKDIDISLIRGMRVAVIGYGSQGHAHALNLRDSGVAMTIGLPENSTSAARAKEAGFTVLPPAAAVRDADLVAIMAPDEKQPDLYRDHLHNKLKPGATLLFAHGFAVHFKLIVPREDLDVVMIAPKGPGPQVRSEFAKGSGLLGLLAVQQDKSGQARAKALSYAGAIGCGRSGILESTFREECECDLFGEQAVLCGGISHLIRAGFETLVEAGYAPEAAYLECLHETKLVVDLLYERGLSGMHKAISNTAEYGDYVTGPRIITDETRAEMKNVLEDIRSGRFAHQWMMENKAGQPFFKEARRKDAEHPIEKIGARIRALIPTLRQHGRNH